MRRNQRHLLWLASSILGALIVSPALLLGQASPDSKPEGPAFSDWSQHHVFFSKPATAERARRVQQDPRYEQQIMRHSPRRSLEAASGALASPSNLGANAALRRKNPEPRRDWSQDMGSGASVGAGNFPAKFSFSSTTAYCAGAAQPDYVVYGTGLAGSSTQANIVAYDNLYSGCNGIHLGTAANFAILGASTVTNAGDSVVTGGNIGISPGTSLTGFGPGVLTPPAVEQLGTPVAAQAQADATAAFNSYQARTGATLISSALDGLTFGPGLYKTGSDPTLSLGAGATVTLSGSGTYIFQIGSTLNIAGTVVLSGGATAGNVIWLVGSSATLEGTAVAAGNIVASASITLDSGASVAGRTIALTGAITLIDNAVTAVDTLPSVYWAYNTGDGTILTSPVLSRDGSQVAFMKENASGHGVLVLLKWAASTTETVGSPRTLSPDSPFYYPTCVAPCITTIALDVPSGPVADTNSSVFYDYSNDAAYVGDDAGYLHKFSPVFNGVPAEVTAGGWPVLVNPTTPTALTSPVYDSGSGNVFVADKGGYVYRVNSTTPTPVTQSALLDHSTAEDGGPGMVEGPIVDSSAGLIYVFATSDGSGGCTGGADCSVVYVTSTSFSGGAVPLRAIVGASTVAGTAPSPLYIGTFDTAYENSVGPPSGNLYVCGNTGGNPILYQVGIKAGVLGTVSAGAVLSTSISASASASASGTPCSPVTDVLNPNISGGATEWIFASAQASGASSRCGGSGCIFNFKVTPWQPSTAYAIGQEVLDSNLHIQAVGAGGTSGAITPGWSTTAGGPTTDGTVKWVDQGVESAVTPAAWAASFSYSAGALILDSNGNIELCIYAFGTSGSSVPAWNPDPGSVTVDNSVVGWENLGAIATAALAAAGGTSGIIVDNTVAPGTLAGASQIYFSTLGSQACGSSGTGGCAVQASQPVLQ